MNYVNIERFSVYQTFSTQRLGNSYLSSVVQLSHTRSQTSSLKPFLPTRALRYKHALHTTATHTKEHSGRTHTKRTHAHLFEDPTNLSNSALGMLLMGDRGRG